MPARGSKQRRRATSGGRSGDASKKARRTPSRAANARGASKSRAASGGGAAGARLGSGLRLARRVAPPLLVVAAIGGAVLGVPALGDHAARIILRQQRPMHVVLDRPAWLPEPAYNDLVARAIDAFKRGTGEVGGLEPLDFRPLRAVQRAIADSGWAASTPRVYRRRSDAVTPDQSATQRRDDIVIEMAWRKPAAVVRGAPRRPGAPALAYAVDAGGVVLPLAGPPGTLVDLPAIERPKHAPADGGAPGLAWPGEDVADALALLALLGERGLGERIAGVDVSEHHAGRRLLLVTRGGGSVVWGTPPGGEGIYRGEVDDAQKLANLRTLLTSTDAIGPSHGRVEIHWPGPVLIDDGGGGGP